MRACVRRGGGGLASVVGVSVQCAVCRVHVGVWVCLVCGLVPRHLVLWACRKHTVR